MSETKKDKLIIHTEANETASTDIHSPDIILKSTLNSVRLVGFVIQRKQTTVKITAVI